MHPLLSGVLLLSVLHAALPSHWLPFITMGQTERWGLRRTLLVTAVAVAGHVASTGLVGGLLGWFSADVISAYAGAADHLVAPALLVLLGLVYLGYHFSGKRHTHSHTPGARHAGHPNPWVMIGTLMLTLFLSPCIEVMVYFIDASREGIELVFWLWVAYASVTVALIVALVALGYYGIAWANTRWFEHNDRLLTGTALVLLGVFQYVVG